MNKKIGKLLVCGLFLSSGLLVACGYESGDGDDNEQHPGCPDSFNVLFLKGAAAQFNEKNLFNLRK